MSKLTTTQILANAVEKYGDYLDAGASYGAAMQAAAKSLGGTPCPTFLGELAALHATKYQCSFTWDGKGRAVFFNGEESTRETRNDAARKSWGRNVMVWFNKPEATQPTKSQRISKAHRDAAKAYLAQFENVKDAIAVLRAIAK